jgi:hypothetical protein
MMADEAGADEDVIIVYAPPYKVLFSAIVHERINQILKHGQTNANHSS